ncbi:MAG: efflux RND transporter periplasmic adaptor subunit [Massilibacteroides sp.]|nr:efflux RND transporter periplasmic adaptor subunit [Massilibacteroides sp.]
MKTKTIVLSLSTGVLFLASACSSSTSDKNRETPVNVSVYTPGQTHQNAIQVSGLVTSKQTATISTRMMGHVQKIHVKPGDRVKAGQLLISINSNDILAKKQQVKAMLAEVQAAEKNAKRDYERFKALRDQNSVSPKEFENVELQYTSMKSKMKMAEEALNEVNVQLTYFDITAPFSGTVTRKLVDEGSMANPGMPLLVVEQAGDLIVQASVAETNIPFVKVGDKAVVEIKSADVMVNGKIVELSPSAYGTSGQYLMKVALENVANQSIRSGMFANLTLEKTAEQTNENAALLVDNGSLVYRDQLTGVYIVDNENQAILKWLRLGKGNDLQTEVISGLSPDDRVVKQSEGKLYNGKKVIISNK